MPWPGRWPPRELPHRPPADRLVHRRDSYADGFIASVIELAPRGPWHWTVEPPPDLALRWSAASGTVHTQSRALDAIREALTAGRRARGPRAERTRAPS